MLNKIKDLSGKNTSYESTRVKVKKSVTEMTQS